MIALGFSAALALCVAAGIVLLRARERVPLEARLLEARQAHLHGTLRRCLEAARSSPEEVLRRFSQAVRELDPAIDAILCFERSGAALRCTFAEGAETDFIRDTTLPLEADAAPPVAAFLQGHRIASRGLQTALLPTDRAFLAVPLSDGARPFGACYCLSRRVDALAAEASIVALAELAGPAIALARERARDREHASLDALTGLLTPRTLRDRLAELDLRPGTLVALAFVDSDNFKACNDALGHAAGDAVLKELARILRAAAGPGALVARNGGDEFCILFAGLPKSDAIHRAEAVRAAVERHAFEPVLAGRTPSRPITASIGLAGFPDDAASAGELLERADAAMYHSKRAGRNRVSFYAASGELCTLR